MPLSTTSIIFTAFLASLFVLLVAIVWRIGRTSARFAASAAAVNSARSGALGHSVEGAESLSYDRPALVEYYRPMALLLDAKELAAARELSHVTEAEFKIFRQQRISAFRKYLFDLKLDFSRLEFKLRYLLLSAPASQAPLVQRLNQLKLQFTWNLYMLEFRLLLFSFGLGTLDISGLLEELASLEQALQPRHTQSAAV